MAACDPSLPDSWQSSGLSLPERHQLVRTSLGRCERTHHHRGPTQEVTVLVACVDGNCCGNCYADGNKRLCAFLGFVVSGLHERCAHYRRMEPCTRAGEAHRGIKNQALVDLSLTILPSTTALAELAGWRQLLPRPSIFSCLNTEIWSKTRR